MTSRNVTACQLRKVNAMGGQGPEQSESTLAGPRCPGCGGELVEADQGRFALIAGVALVLIGLAACGLVPFGLHEAFLAPGAAAIISGMALARRKLRWHCASCDRSFRRRLPPRGFADEAKKGTDVEEGD